MKLTDSVENLPGVGKVKAAELYSAGVRTVRDLITRYPRDYLDRSVVTPLTELENGLNCTVETTVVKTELSGGNGKIIVKVLTTDGAGHFMRATFFNQSYLRNLFAPKKRFSFSGVFKRGFDMFVTESPDYEEIRADRPLLKSRGIIPVYAATEKVSRTFLLKLTRFAFDLAAKGELELPPESLPDKIIQMFDLCGRDFALRNIHFPESEDAFFAARKRLVFEEILLMQLALYHVKGAVKKCEGPRFKELETAEVERRFPFTLTNGQRAVLNEMTADFGSGMAMNRLVQGDVGSGKTAVAMIGAYLAARNGFQTAIMAPTEVLASQHFQGFVKVLTPLGVAVAQLSGGMRKREKDAVKAGLSNGEIDVVIGTHALIQDGVSFARLGFAVTDEQHRFGVRQRAKLPCAGGEQPCAGGEQKDFLPHTLVMTATPIPRTLALVLYGDLDVSSITELPPGRTLIKTNAVTSSYHARVYNFVREHASQGRQAYVICPLVEASEVVSAKAAVDYAKALSEGELSGLNVRCLHGRMGADEKAAIMAAFANGEIDALVSTTVVEVGVNVPNASVIVIENAERFGLAQLHQLRGRVGRGTAQSYCVLVCDAKNDVAKKRMKAMTETTDGFKLSELDLELRGPGEFFGTRQHGLPELKIANLYKDMNVMQETLRAARTLIETREYLDFPPLREEIERLAVNGEERIFL